MLFVYKNASYIFHDLFNCFRLKTVEEQTLRRIPINIFLSGYKWDFWDNVVTEKAKYALQMCFRDKHLEKFVFLTNKHTYTTVIHIEKNQHRKGSLYKDFSQTLINEITLKFVFSFRGKRYILLNGMPLDKKRKFLLLMKKQPKLKIISNWPRMKLKLKYFNCEKWK